MSSEGTSTGWIFTIWKGDEWDEQIRMLKRCEDPEWSANILGISVGKEIGPKCGRLHLQGYVRLAQNQRSGWFQKLMNAKFFMKKAGGDWEANAKYTSKDENMVAFRAPPEKHQGVRTDLMELRDTLKRRPEIEVDELAELHLSQLAKYPRLVGQLKQAYLKKQTRPFRDVEVIVHWGKSGTGKTRKPYEEGAYVFTDYEDKWWDGYDQESVVLFDEFYGGIKWSLLLTWLDGYQQRLKVKGGFTYATWTKVYISSNVHPRRWYAKAAGDGARGLCPELERRITDIVEFQ